MYGYIGDNTNQENRTTFIAILAGMGIIIFPLAEMIGGQIFKYGGYYWVYGTALFCCLSGIAYVTFIPESVVKRNLKDDDDGPDINELSWQERFLKRFKAVNWSIVESYKCLVRPRNGKQRTILLLLLGISILRSIEGYSSSGLLFTERQFDWTVVDYTNYRSVAMVSYAFRTFVTTSILCSVFHIHDCMLAITGWMASIASDVTIVRK